MVVGCQTQSENRPLIDINNPNSNFDPTGSFPWAALLIVGVFALGGLIFGATSDTKLWKNVSNKKNPNYSEPKVKANVAQQHSTSTYSNAVPHKNSITRKNNSSAKNNYTTNNNASFNEEKHVLTVGDRVINAFIGLSIGVMVGGGIACTAGIVATVAVGPFAIIPLFGCTGPQTAAVGALAFNVVVMFVLPAFGVTTIEPIEFSQ